MQKSLFFFKILSILICLNFWDEVWYFLSFRIFGLFTSSTLLYFVFRPIRRSAFFKLYNSHNLTSVICLHTVCSIWLIDRALSGVPLQVRVDIIAIAMKGYSTFLISPKLKLYHQMVLCHIQDARWVASYPSAEMLSVHSITPADRKINIYIYNILQSNRQRVLNTPNASL